MIMLKSLVLKISNKEIQKLSVLTSFNEKDMGFWQKFQFFKLFIYAT